MKDIIEVTEKLVVENGTKWLLALDEFTVKVDAYCPDPNFLKLLEKDFNIKDEGFKGSLENGHTTYTITRKPTKQKIFERAENEVKRFEGRSGIKILKWELVDDSAYKY